MKHNRWWVPVIMMVGLALRVIALESRTLEYDDAFSILLAERSLGEIVSGTAADTMPPIYYFLLHFWMGISTNLWFIRLLNIGLSLGIVLVSIQLGIIVHGEKVGWVAGLLTAVSPLQIFHAQGMRMYVILTLANLSYIWFLLRLLENEANPAKTRWNWIGLVLSGAAAMYSHNLAIFGLLAPNVVFLIQRRWRLLRHLIIAQLVIGLLASPWLLLVPGQVAKIQAAFWTPRPGILEVVQTLVTFHTNVPVPSGFLPVALLISLSILVFTTVEIMRILTRESSTPIVVRFRGAAPYFLVYGLIF